jgi:hypothetical protein
MQLIAEPISTPILFDWGLSPAGPTQDKSVQFQEERKELEGRNNRLQIGTPQVTDLRRLQDAGGVKTIDFDLFDADFLLVRLACSFMPDRRSRYIWGRFSVELKAVPEQPNASAIAFDMFPISIERQTTVKRSFELAPTLKFSFLEASVKASTSNETVSYEPQVSGGLLTSTPTWTFTASNPLGIIGSREMFLVLKLPRGTRCGARFGIVAEVYGKFGPIPVRRPGESARSDDLFMLDPG